MSNFRVVTPTIQLVKLIFPPLRALQCSAPPPLVHAPSVAAVAQAGKGCPTMPARRHHLPLCSHCLWLPSRHGVKQTIEALSASPQTPHRPSERTPPFTSPTTVHLAADSLLPQRASKGSIAVRPGPDLLSRQRATSNIAVSPAADSLSRR